MLSRRVKNLQCYGIVERHVEPTTPPLTTYDLTENGDAFVGLFEDINGIIGLAGSNHTR